MAFPKNKCRYAGWLTPVGHAVYGLKRLCRHARITRAATALLGPQYRSCRDIIEIDITYECNLKCLNCNRSCRQAPSAERMELSQIERFVEESRRRGKVWRMIKVMGGEPTLHPELAAILRILLEGCARPHGTSVVLVSNGFGTQAREIIRSLPREIIVDPLSLKDSPVQPQFGAFNMAPADSSWFRFASYRNACKRPSIVGIGLTPFGYYGCPMAGGIDRVAGWDIGRKHLPEDADEMEDHFERFCRLCGRFTEGHLVPWNLKRPLSEERISPAWRKLYAAYREHPPSLTRYI
ncbi:MAG: radical SAM protein [Candidatus Brocadiia bacterium]